MPMVIRIEEKAAAQKSTAPANPFGMPNGQDDGKPEDFELPAEFSKFLPKQ